MADLVSLAQRLNDVEINNDAPVSSQTFRRVGSDINFLLDYLGIDNGDTLGGPTTGLNVFSAVQSFSYSYTFTSADFNVPKTLFTFEGGGDRPLQFFQRSTGNFRIAEAQQSFDTSNAANVSELTTIRTPGVFLPCWNLLYQLHSSYTNSVSIGSPIFTVHCNGVEMGRTIRQTAPLVTIQYSREITHAPSGTNTVTVTLNAPTIASTAVSSSLEYVAL